jgi:hypothetical protein
MTKEENRGQETTLTSIQQTLQGSGSATRQELVDEEAAPQRLVPSTKTSTL